MKKLINIFYCVLLLQVLLTSCVESENTTVSQIQGSEHSIEQDVPLPIYGQKEFVKGVDTDTVYHTIPDFSFINQNGDTITKAKFEGKPYVSYFFFSSCPSVCPKMTNNMKYFQEQTKDLEIRIIAHTVDPERDTVAKLKVFAEEYDIDDANFDMVTGIQKDIYELGVLGYMVPNQEDALAPGGFLHSEKIMLIDSKSRVRGFYSGTNKDEIDQLIADIKKLIVDESNN